MSETIYNKDCFEILPTLATGSVDCIITDPVYGEKIDLTEMLRVCKGNILMFCNPKLPVIQNEDENGWWIKSTSTKNYKKHIGNFVERIQILRRGDTFNVLHWSQMTGVWDDRLILPPEHPWEKPLSLIERLIRIYSNPGDTILDPFMGSGTTILAARSLKRNAIGMENDPVYYALAERNLRH